MCRFDATFSTSWAFWPRSGVGWKQTHSVLKNFANHPAEEVLGRDTRDAGDCGEAHLAGIGTIRDGSRKQKRKSRGLTRTNFGAMKAHGRSLDALRGVKWVAQWMLERKTSLERLQQSIRHPEVQAAETDTAPEPSAILNLKRYSPRRFDSSFMKCDTKARSHVVFMPSVPGGLLKLRGLLRTVIDIVKQRLSKKSFAGEERIDPSRIFATRKTPEPRRHSRPFEWMVVQRL